MKIKYLRDFVVAAKCPDMRQTAEKLNIAPSVLSKHIKQIEEELGVPIFASSKRNTLTVYGEILLPYAEEIVNLEDDFFNREKLLNDSEAKNEKLIIAMSPIQTREQSGRIFENFAYSNTNIKLEKLEVGNSELVNCVKERKCDFAFYRTDSTLEKDNAIRCLPVCSSKAFVHMSKKNPLSNRESVRLEDLKDETIYLRSENSAIYKVCMNEFNKIGITPKVEFVSEHQAYENIKHEKGITIYLSELINTEYVDSIKMIPIEPEITSYIDLIFRNEQLSPIKAQFLEYVFRAFMLYLK